MGGLIGADLRSESEPPIPTEPSDEESLARIQEMIAKNPEMLKNEQAQKLLREVEAAGYDWAEHTQRALR
jgi:hypothetical protein